MAKRWKTVVKMGGVLLAVLVVTQFATYWFAAPRRVIWTIDRFLPQHNFSFACISQATLEGLSDPEKKGLRTHLLHSFPTVYLGEKTIPAEAKEEGTNKRTGERILHGLKGGCILSMRVERRGFMWFHSRYADWEGEMGASGREATFIWVLGRWWAIKGKVSVMA